MSYVDNRPRVHPSTPLRVKKTFMPSGDEACTPYV